MKAIQKQNTDPKVVMMQTMQKTVRVGSNGGTAAGLSAAMTRSRRASRRSMSPASSSSCCQFQPFEAEMRRFALEVIPRVRAKQSAGPAEGLVRSSH